VNRNIIRLTADYFGLAYYSFLLGYALYKMVFSGEYISIIVFIPFNIDLTMRWLLLTFPIFNNTTFAKTYLWRNMWWLEQDKAL
jgi:hypothetical protein